MCPARPALTQEQQQMVRRLRGEGMTWQKAARAVGCSFTSAWFIGAGRAGTRSRPASWTPRPGSLSIADREEITIGLIKGESFTAIAQRINKVPSTVSREVAANGGRDDYRAWAGYLRAEQRCRRPKPTKLASSSHQFAMASTSTNSEPSLPSAASVTPSTMRWPRRSTPPTRASSSEDPVKDRGGTWRTWSWPPWRGSTGTTSRDCTSTSTTSRRLNSQAARREKRAPCGPQSPAIDAGGRTEPGEMTLTGQL